MIILLYIIILFITLLLFFRQCNNKESFVHQPKYKASYSQKIPFIICTTHESDACSNNLNIIKALNPEYTIYFFDDLARIQFIQQYFAKNVLNAYLKLIPGAFKADLFRYCFLFHHGGVYIDINKKLVNPLREIIYPQATMGLVLNSNHDLGETPKIINGFIYIVPQHKLMKKCIDQCVANIESNYYGDSFLSVTGPYMFGGIFKQIYGTTLFYLSYGLHLIDDMVLHVMKFNENNYIIDVLANKKVLSFTERHDCKLEFSILPYTEMWSKKKIYVSDLEK